VPDASCHWWYWFLELSLRVAMACYQCHIYNASGLCILSFLVLCMCFLEFGTTYVFWYHCDMFWTYVQNVSKSLFVCFLLYTTMAMLWYYFVRASTIIEVCFQWLKTTYKQMYFKWSTCFNQEHNMLPFINLQHGQEIFCYIIVHASTIIKRCSLIKLYGRTKS
jgi:hypothetical protein